jgi:hypothetical protein
MATPTGCRGIRVGRCLQGLGFYRAVLVLLGSHQDEVVGRIAAMNPGGCSSVMGRASSLGLTLLPLIFFPLCL